MIGHELGGRYEIITRIGGGGMALYIKRTIFCLTGM